MNNYSSIHIEYTIDKFAKDKCISERSINMVDNKSFSDRCDCNVIHEDVVNEVKKKMPGEENLYDLAELFKVFGDTTRIKILWALAESDMCVCDIAVLLNMTQSAISHQLRVLKQARLVKNRKEGKIVFYSLDDEHVKQIFDQGMVHINEK
jgi:ArsR family transcriptional regulator